MVVKKGKDKTKELLKKEVNLPIPEQSSKAGKFLTAKRRVWVPKYVRESWQELKKVSWPSRKDSWKLTFAVIVFTALFTLITALADYGLDRTVERLFL